MGKKLFYLVLLGFITISFHSCVATNKGYQSSPVLARNVDLDPIKADIIVNEKEKLKGESSSSYFLIFRTGGDNTFADGIYYSAETSSSVFSRMNPFKAKRLAEVRGAAAYNALKGSDYDVLVHPNYSITVENYLIAKKYRATVEGYGAKYTNFRTEKQKVIITNNNNEYVFPDK